MKKEFVVTIVGDGKNLSIQIRNQEDFDLLDTLIEWVKTKAKEQKI